MELEDFIAEYPPPDIPDFQGMLSSKLEFLELAGDKNEPIPSSISEFYLRHQKMFMREMSHYDEQWKMDEAGTGKTCALGALAMHAKKHLPHIKKCIIVCGEDQLEQFKMQLVMKCTQGEYITKSVLESQTDEGKSMSISKALSDFFEFYTYGGYRKMVEDNYPTGMRYDVPSKSWISDEAVRQDSNTRIIQDLSGTIHLFDEFHFRRIEDTKHRFTTIKETGERVPSRRIREYMAIWRVKHLIVRSKWLVFTATPVTNIATEMNYHLNIFYPLDRQLYTPLMEEIAAASGLQVTGWQEPPDWITRRDYDVMLTEYVDHLAKNMRAKISFVAATQHMATPSYVPILQPTINQQSDLAREIQMEIENGRNYALQVRQRFGGQYNELERVRFVPMTGIQKAVYIKFLQESVIEELSDIDPEEPVNNPAYYNERSICGGVFPDGSYGTQGTSEWIIEDSDHNFSVNPAKTAYDPTTERIDPVTGMLIPGSGVSGDLSYWFSRHLYQLSAKAYKICRGAMYLPGKRYVASTFVKAIGAVYIGLALENFPYRDLNTGQEMPYMRNKKFTRYRGDPATFQSRPGIADTDKLRIGIGESYRYAIINASTSKKEKKDIYALFNHPENVDGQYLKVIIISKVGQTGISLQEDIYVDFFDVPWNPGTEYQTKNRAIRTFAHVIHQRRLEQERLFKGSGRRNWREALQKPKVEVEVNMMVCQLVNDDDGTEMIINGREVSTADLRIYLRMSDRGRRNAVSVRAMKIVAIDCRLQKRRNTLDPSFSGTPEADYGPAEYPCLGWNGGNYYYYDCKNCPTNIDTSTYDVYYIDSVITRVKKIIIELFHRKNVLTIDDVLTYYPDIGKRKYVIATLNDMIKNGETIIDSFGFVCYVRESMGNFFVTRREERSDPFSDITTIYFNTNIVGVNYREFKDVVFEKAFGDAYKYLDELEKSQTPYLALQDILQKTTILEKIGITEMVIQKYSNDFLSYINNGLNPSETPNNLPGSIFKAFFARNLFAWNEPRAYIDEVTRLIETGHTTLVNSFREQEIRLLRTLSETPVFIHNLYSLVTTASKAGQNKRLSEALYPIRIFLPSEGHWRYPSQYELPAYRWLMKEKFNKQATYYENRFPRYYAIYKTSGIYDIINREHESDYAPNSKRSEATGKAWSSFKELELLFYCWQLGVYISETYADSKTPEEKRVLVANWKGEKLFTYKSWTIKAGFPNSVPDKFINYCYKHLAKRKIVGDNSANKLFLAIKILEKFIVTDRIYSPSLDVYQLLEMMHQKHSSQFRENRPRKNPRQKKEKTLSYLPS